MISINPKETPLPKLHQYMLGSMAPRPIAFASTLDKEGRPNLAPFSFFNAFGSNPPVVAFSPARSGRDNTTKNTLDNIEETKEVVINIVHYAMVHQMSLASCPYPKGVNEFLKSGLTPIASEIVKPFRVKESNVQLECKVLDIVKTGSTGGAGNMIICEILLIHINESILNEDGRMDPYKMDLVARMGGDYYCRVIPESIFVLPQPKTEIGIGVDVLPEHIRHSTILTGNNLGQLGIFQHFPTDEELAETRKQYPVMPTTELHQLAKSKLDNGEAWEAFKMLLMNDEW